ncbi:hypothetical protein ABZ569_33300 [Streptomyces albus]|uniref:hypothetical protein n=1 Tax=Streptomyces albus TaxID=1888 RepID=UPI0033EA9FDC
MQPPVIEVASNLRQTEHNRRIAKKAVRRIIALGWLPLSPYPGSDTLWFVRCTLCGWEGMRFYSHIGRNRPAERHPADSNGRSCVPLLKRPYEGRPIPREQPVLYPYSAHTRAAAWLALHEMRKRNADLEGDADSLRAELRMEHKESRLIGVGNTERDAIRSGRLRGFTLPPGTHEETMADLKKDCMTRWVPTPYGIALVGE